MKYSMLALGLSWLLLGGCLSVADDDDSVADNDDSVADDDDSVADDDDSVADDDDSVADDDDSVADDDDSVADDDDSVADDDDSVADDDDSVADDDDSTEPAPIDVGLVWGAALYGFDVAPTSVTTVLEASDVPGADSFVSGSLTDSSGATVGLVTASSTGFVDLTWSPASHDWRAENPAMLDLSLTVTSGGQSTPVTGQWAIEALPSEAAVHWDDSDGWVLLPAALALAPVDALRFGSTWFAPASEPLPGLWGLGPASKPNYIQLNQLCTTAGSGPEQACFDNLQWIFNGNEAKRFTATAADGQTGVIDLVEPFDWDDDGDRDVDDVIAWHSGTAPCRQMTMSSEYAPYLVGASQHVIAGTLDVEIDASAEFGLPVDTVSGTVWEYSGSIGNYSVGSQITGAVVANQGSGVYTLEMPPSAYEFRVTNPATVHTEIEALDAGGRCYEAEQLVTVGATPEYSAVAWIDGALYLGAGGLVAPRPGSSLYFDTGSTTENYGAIAEIETGIWQMDATAQPVFADLDLLYYSAGQRYATVYNEAYLYSFSTLSTSPLILEGSILSLTGEVHFPTLTDLDGDGDVTPSDLRAYLNTL